MRLLILLAIATSLAAADAKPALSPVAAKATAAYEKASADYLAAMRPWVASLKPVKISEHKDPKQSDLDRDSRARKYNGIVSMMGRLVDDTEKRGTVDAANTLAMVVGGKDVAVIAEFSGK